ncbi:adenine phosphoribosyltransferase [bacterium]|nr:adenine phosphoribosyltransferase [bacterium]
MGKQLETLIRDIPDFPKPGVIFKDITPLLAEPEAWRQTVDRIAEQYEDKSVEQVVCVEARGFIIGAPLAYKLGAGVVLVRKPGKLPFQTLRTTYALEYGTDSLEIHTDAIVSGTRVLIADDVLATGGTVCGTVDLIRKLEGRIVGIAFLIELEFLKGRQRLEGQDIFSLIKY